MSVARWPATAGGWVVADGLEQGGVKGWPARCNPPPMGDGMGRTGSRGDCLASMRPADALAYPCGAWCGLSGTRKNRGPGVASCFLCSGYVLRAGVRKRRVGAVPISISLSKG